MNMNMNMNVNVPVMLFLATFMSMLRQGLSANASLFEPLTWAYHSEEGMVPPTRMFFAMAPLSHTSEGSLLRRSENVILFGGLCGGPSDSSGELPYHYHNDTWLINKSRVWKRVPHDGYPPPSRFHHAMTNLDRNSVILFGGQRHHHLNMPTAINQIYMDDLWLFRLINNQWSAVHADPSVAASGLPSARAQHQMARFRPQGYNYPLVLLFGGKIASGLDTSETWILEVKGNTGHPRDALDSKWHLIPEKNEWPSARSGHAMSELGRESIVVFGGYDTVKHTVLGDTWVFIGDTASSAWYSIKSMSSRDEASIIISNVQLPPPRRYASFASFDAETAILFGGTSEKDLETHSGSNFSDTSTWHLSRNTNDPSVHPSKRYTWRRLVPFQVDYTQPVARYGHSASPIVSSGVDIEHKSLASVLVFGGIGKMRSYRKTLVTTVQDTWIFHGGCPLGTYRSLNNETECEGCYSCPIGTYKESSAMIGSSSQLDSCNPCPKGTTTPFAGAPHLWMCSECLRKKNNASDFTGICAVVKYENTSNNDSTLIAVWQCNKGYYGCGGDLCRSRKSRYVPEGRDCSLKCKCASDDQCQAGWYGDGSCHCGHFGYWFSQEDCGTQLWTFLIISASIILTVTLIALLVRKQRKKRKKYIQNHRELKRDKMDLEVSKALLKEQHLREINEFEEGWNIDERDLTWVCRLASGGYGEVWKGTYAAFPGKEVAIKKFFLRPDTIEMVQSRGAFADKEVAVLAKTPSHRNIVYLIGAGQLQLSKEIFLVSEFMCGGDLRTLLDGGVSEECDDSATREFLSWERRLQILRDVAEGMAFLHARAMIHRDLKSLNVLLEGTPMGRAKIADFGLSKFTGSHHAILRQFTQNNGDDHEASSRISTSSSANLGGEEKFDTTANRLDLTRQMYLSFRRNAAVKDKHRMTFLKKLCPVEHLDALESNQNAGVFFTGHEAVEWLVNHLGLPGGTLEAQLLGSKLMQSGFLRFTGKELSMPSKKIATSSYNRLLDDKYLLYTFDLDKLGAIGSEEKKNSSEQGNDGISAFSSQSPSSTSSSSSLVTNPSSSSFDSSPFQTALTANAGSLLWMAPEVLGQAHEKALYGLATDVYSFGVMVYETISRRYPWYDLSPPLQIKIFTKVLQGERPKLTTEEMQEVHQSEIGKLLHHLMERSWQQDPKERPTFEEMANVLSAQMAKSKI